MSDTSDVEVVVGGVQLKGSLQDGVAQFRATYAEADRWRPPRQVVRAAPAPVCCPQPGRPLGQDEDCLQLNLWTPHLPHLPHLAPAAPASRAPVLVYIHGGGGKSHCAHSPHESGHLLALRQGLCCVNINYRLGLFGFFAHPELSEEDAASAVHGGVAGCGNYAVLDQICALQWVQKHIATFGGDPDNVTVWGLSSGAQYVCTLLVSPLAAGLFHRAVVQSCADLNNVRSLRGRSLVWPRTAEQSGQALADLLLSSAGAGAAGAGAAGTVGALRRLEAAALVARSFAPEAADCYEPAVDARSTSDLPVRPVKPKTSVQALAAGEFVEVPLLLGVTAQDGLGKSELEQVIFREVRTRTDLDQLLQREFGHRASEVLLHYWPEEDAEPQAVHKVLSKLSDDLWYFAGTHLMAELVSKTSKCPVFVYCFAGTKRSVHGSDATFWRGAKATKAAKSKLSQIMSCYLGNFARSGDPNRGELPEWKAVEGDCEQWMHLGAHPGMQPIPDLSWYRFLAEEYFFKRVCEESESECKRPR
ncbi:unnamed protein product, partial [Effrenium voratum]